MLFISWCAGGRDKARVRALSPNILSVTYSHLPKVPQASHNSVAPENQYISPWKGASYLTKQGLAIEPGPSILLDP